MGFVRLQECSPPLVHGVARLAGMLFAGASVGDLLDLIGPKPDGGLDEAGWFMDRAWTAFLNACPAQGEALQQQALARSQTYRVRSGAGGARLLALAAPGGLMVNAPLDFIAAPGGLRLDIAFVAPDLPPSIPDHDVAITTVSEAAPAALATLGPAVRNWPRPVLNDPARIMPMSRDWLPRVLSAPGVHCPAARSVTRRDLGCRNTASLLPEGRFPFLLRPAGSHAGHGLARLDDEASVRQLLTQSADDAFTLTQFVDYRGADGWFRKYRVAFVAGAPFICHMAASDHWMVHYLNAGMDESPAKRVAEAAALCGHDGFLERHAAALAAVADAIGLDYCSIDCGEAPDGRLLVFEADVAAIIHSMDPPDRYPYKRPAMQRCYDAFAAMVHRRAGLAAPH